jgi:hypothetical protein
MSNDLRAMLRQLEAYSHADIPAPRMLEVLRAIVDRLEPTDKEPSNPSLYVRLQPDEMGRSERVRVVKSFWACNDQEAIDYFGTSNAVYRRIDHGPTS